MKSNQDDVDWLLMSNAAASSPTRAASAQSGIPTSSDVEEGRSGGRDGDCDGGLQEVGPSPMSCCPFELHFFS